MSRWLRAAWFGVMAAMLGGAGHLGATVSVASAHGSMENPISRVYECYLEGPETPKSAACRAAVAVGGTQALYDWPAVSRQDAAGQSRSLIPDGHLCSANQPEYQGLDL